jgi:serine/threonine protein kinase
MVISSPILAASESRVWDSAFQSWSAKHPGGTEEKFSEAVLKEFWKEYQISLGEKSGSEDEFVESLFKEYGTHLPLDIVKYASAIFLGDREHRLIGDGSYGSVVRGLEKEKRDEKIWIFSPNIQEHPLGEGGLNVVEKIKGISFVARAGAVTTKGIREYATREPKSPSMSRLLTEKQEEAPEDPGNETLALTHRTAREDVESGRKLPLGVQLDEKGRVVGLVKPFLVEVKDPKKAYMKLYKGGSFESWIKNFNPSHQEILKAFGGGMHGFAALITYGLMHKDIKPGNLFVDIDENGVVAVKVSDFDGVFEASRVSKDIDPDELLGLVQNFPISDNEGLSFAYNLLSDYELFSSVCSKTEKAVVDLEETLEELDAIPEEERTEADYQKVDDARDNLVSLRNQQILLVREMQVFQMSLSLYESLAGPDSQIKRDPASIFKFVIQPVDKEEIADLVKKLNLTSEQAETLTQFFSETIGKDTMERADGKMTYKLYQKLEQLL